MGSGKPVIFNLDDFCEKNMTEDKWKVLNALHKKYPGLKITMLTVPMKSSEGWLKYVKKHCPFIEMALHGTDHEQGDDYYNKSAVHTAISFYNPDIYVKGFKAPNWHMNKEAYDEFRKEGFWVCTNGKHDFALRSDDLNYKYSDGEMKLKDMLYECDKYKRLHGHITPSYNGILEVSQEWFYMFTENQEFKFISEIF